MVFKCEGCGLFYTSQGRLRYHLFNERQKCEFVNHLCSNAHKHCSIPLTQHKYQCPYCEMSYDKKKRLTAHLGRAHKNQHVEERKMASGRNDKKETKLEEREDEIEMVSTPSTSSSPPSVTTPSPPVLRQSAEIPWVFIIYPSQLARFVQKPSFRIEDLLK